jgi:hypothetical protein
MEQKTVAGEPIEVLQAALAKMTHRKAIDGMVEISLSLEPELGEPLRRALLRIEKELLDHDMAHGGPAVGPRHSWPMPLWSSRSASQPPWMGSDATIT